MPDICSRILGTGCPEKPEIYDFIVFRGSTKKEQIEDLHFFGTGYWKCSMLYELYL
jgi:hypothetical protein